MRKGKKKCNNKNPDNNKKYMKTILSFFIPSCGTISIFNIINWIYEFIKPKLTVSKICIILICVLIICAIILIIVDNIISYKKYKKKKEEETKRMECYLKYNQKIFVEKEKTKQLKIKLESNKYTEEAPYGE